MTLEELKEKYPVGSKVTVVPNLSYRERHAAKYISWSFSMDYLYGKTVEVAGHDSHRNEFYIIISGKLGVDWCLIPEWLDKGSSAEDPDALLKKQRDDLLASIFGG